MRPIPIAKKPIHKAPLARMLLPMQQYQIEVRYRSGKEIPIPDTFSSKSVLDTCPSLSDGSNMQINMVMSYLSVKWLKLEQETGKDEQLCKFKEVWFSL